MSINGSCHCGNVTFALQWAGDPDAIPARVCACTFCRKHGNVWTAHPGASVRVRLRDPGAVARYAFGTGTAVFHVCGRCGVVPIATSEIAGHTYAVINVNTFEDVAESRLRRAPVDFDGEATEARLARRQRHWIGDVVIEGAA